VDDGVGKRTTLLDSTGVSRLYQYDPVGRLTTQVDYDGSSTPIVTFADGYDAVGNRTGRNYNGVITTWVYDDAYRLTGQLQSGQRATSVYNGSGNITLKHHEGSDPMSMTFDAANRLVTTQQGSTLGTYTHDANGNLTGEQVGGLRITFVYDQENRQLQEIRSSGSRHTYTYEPDGLRRSAFHAGTADVVTFIWDGDDLLNERIEGANAARYAVLEGEILSEKRGASRYRFVPDPLGSVRALLDTSGSIVATRDYRPYGAVAAQSGGMTALQFIGALGYFTDATNRIYIRARHYRPDLGRWVTVDPIGFAGGDTLLCRYVLGSPSAMVDPSGHTPFTCRCYPLHLADAFPLPSGNDRSDQRKCYKRACQNFCNAVHDAVRFADEDGGCNGIAQCSRTNPRFAVCDASSDYWEHCGREICVPDGTGWQGSCANLSNYPNPHWQIIGSWCCVECRMRVCCALLEGQRQHQRLREAFRACEKRPAIL